MKRTGPEPSAFRSSLALLSQLLAGDAAAAERSVSALSADAQAGFVDLCESHGLRFYLAQELEDAALPHAFSAQTRARLGEFLQRRRARQSELLAELDRLAALFDREALDFVLLKGPYLAERYFGGVDRRFFGDLDVLVRPRDLRRAHALLTADGYQRDSLPLLGLWLTTRFTHGFDYQRSGLRLDLHWSLGSHVSYRIDYETLWRDRERMRVGACECAVLSDEYALLFLLVSFFEDLERGAGRLKSAFDIHQMLVALEPAIDWAGFFVRREPEGIAGICQTSLALVLEVFACTERMPRLAASLADRAALGERGEAVRYALLTAPRGALRNKRWAAKYYDCSPALNFLWWSLSLPSRLSVYRARKVSQRSAAR